MKLSPFQSILKKLKELLDLIISKISPDGGDFPCIIEIALFLLFGSFRSTPLSYAFMYSI